MSFIRIKMLLIPLILLLISYQLNAQGINKNNIPSLISEDGIGLKTLFPNDEMNMSVKRDSVNTTLNDSLNKITKNITTKSGTDINPIKLGIVCGATITILGGIYYRWKTAWWNEDNTKFHIYYNHVHLLCDLLNFQHFDLLRKFLDQRDLFPFHS